MIVSLGPLIGAPCVLLLGCATSSCLAWSAHLSTEHEVGYVMFAGVNGRAELCLCALGGQAVGGYPEERYGTLLGPLKGSFASGVTRGMSGAPITDIDGDAIGALARTEGSLGTMHFTWVPRWQIESVFNQCLHDEDLACCRMSSGGSPGTPVVALSMWGDVQYGLTGSTSLVRGNHVVFQGHRLSQTFDPSGSAFCDGHALGVVGAGGQMMTVIVPRSLAGRVDGDGPYGGAATLGKRPDGVKFSIRVVTANGETVEWNVWIARTRSCMEAMLPMLASAIVGDERLYPMPEQCRVSLRAASTQLQRNLGFAGASEFADGMARTWWELLAELDLQDIRTCVETNIVFDSWE